MPGSYPDQMEPGLFVPTTNVWDIGQIIQDIDINSPEFKELLVRLYQNINNISLVLNLKDSGYYPQTEFVNGQLFFPAAATLANTDQQTEYRQVFRLVIDFGALPNATTKSVPHGLTITSGYSFTRIYGAASKPLAPMVTPQFIPLPYASASGTDNIQVDVDDINVTVTTTFDYSAYTITYIILEYIKQ